MIVIAHPVFLGVALDLNSRSVSGFDTAPPAPLDHLADFFPSLAHVSRSDSIKTGHETRVLDHKGHKLCRIAANAEEFEAILRYKLLEYRMRRQSDSMSISFFQDLAQSQERLYVSSRTDYMDDHVEGRRRRLTRFASERRRYVRRWYRLVLYPQLIPECRC